MSDPSSAAAGSETMVIRVILSMGGTDFTVAFDTGSVDFEKLKVRAIADAAIEEYLKLAEAEKASGKMKRDYPDIPNLATAYEGHKAKYVYLSKISKKAPKEEEIDKLEPDELVDGLCLLDGGKRLAYYCGDKAPLLPALGGKRLTLHGDVDTDHGVYIYAPQSAPPDQASLELRTKALAEPLTDELLHHVRWQEPQPPIMLHSLKPLNLKLTISGEDLTYVPPPQFKEAYEFFTKAIRSGNYGRDYLKLFLDGPSGSGKTRAGWELYKRLKNEVNSPEHRLNITAVSYLYIDLTDSFLPAPAIDNVAAETLIAMRILSHLGGITPHGRSNISLDGVLTRLFGGRKGALVLHIDEFHRLPDETVRLLSVVREFSQRPNVTNVILPVCSGLYTDPKFDPAKVSSTVERVPLGFFRDHNMTWQIVRGAAEAVASVGCDAIPLLKEKDFRLAPMNIQYLVEDIAGWPMAAVQLGVNIPCRPELGPTSSAQDMAGLENAVVIKLKETYPIAKIRSAFGGSSEEALFKIATLALCPFPVSGDESINGITVDGIRQYGVIDDQVVEEGPNKGKYFLRISKPLLRIIVEELHVLERILAGDMSQFEAGAMPPVGTSLGDLLRTCRRYDADTQEAVELISHLVAIHAWLVMDKSRPPAPTLLTFRPGAILLGSQTAANKKLSFLESAARAVDAAGKGLTGSACTKARLEAALANGIRLVARTAAPNQNTASFSKACGAGFDVVVRIGEVTHHGQCKGRESGPAAGAPGGDAGVVPSFFVNTLRKLKNAAGEASRARSVCLELLFAGKASPLMKVLLEAAANGTPSDDLKEIKDVLGKNGCVVVIMRDELDNALGSVFGGIAARCEKQQEDAAMEDAGAAAADAGGDEAKEAGAAAEDVVMEVGSSAGEKKEKEKKEKRAKGK